MAPTSRPPLAITGLGVVSPIGVGVPAWFEALQSGQVGIRAQADGLAVARVGDFGARQQIAPASLRRLPRLSQMAIVAAKEALAGAGGDHDSSRVGAVLGTGLGTLNETIAFMRGYLEGGLEQASPLLFPSSVMNAAAGQLALECQLRGVNSTVNHRELSSLGAVLMAWDLLALGKADAILCGAVEELSEPALEGYRRLATCTRGAARPYDRDRDGIALGEGAALILLEREEDALARGAPIRARLTARAESGDHRPRVGWGTPADYVEAARAVRDAAAQASAPIGFVAGAGNGSRLDELELQALAAGLGSPLPPVASLLGQVGESAASGLQRLLAAVFVLERQSRPGTPGLSSPPAAFAAALLPAQREAAVHAALVASFSQGGANAALVLERAPTAPLS